MTEEEEKVFYVYFRRRLSVLKAETKALHPLYSSNSSRMEIKGGNKGNDKNTLRQRFATHKKLQRHFACPIFYVCDFITPIFC